MNEICRLALATLVLFASLSASTALGETKQLDLIVQDASCQPIANALVSIRRPEDQRDDVIANDVGVAMIPYDDAERLVVDIEIPGYVYTTRSWDVGEVPAEDTVCLPESVTISGRILGPDQKLVPGLQLYFFAHVALGEDEYGRRAVSSRRVDLDIAEDGSWTFPFVEPSVSYMLPRVSVSTEHGTLEIAVDKLLKQGAGWEPSYLIKMPELIYCDFEVSDREGPVAGARILGKADKLDFKPEFDVQTGADGTARVPMIAGRDFETVIFHERSAPVARRLRSPRAGTEVRVRLPSPKKLSVRVVDKTTGDPVEGVYMMPGRKTPLIYAFQEFGHVAYTGEDGLWETMNAPAGRVKLVISGEFGMETFYMTARDRVQDLKVVVPERYAVSGLVVDSATGEPITKFELRRLVELPIPGFKPRLTQVEAFESELGEFSYAGPFREPLAYYISAPGYKTQRFIVVDEADTFEDLIVRLQRD